MSKNMQYIWHEGLYKMRWKILVMQLIKTDVNGFTLDLFLLLRGPLEPMEVILMCAH